MNLKYALLDTGDQCKLEKFGDFVIARPCSQALWKPRLSRDVWESADASFSREGENSWKKKKGMPSEWVVELEGVRFKIAPTDFGHLGVFPEHSLFWKEMTDLIQKRKTPSKVLNLFAYSGGATLAAAKAGAHVVHLDASQGMVKWARENAALNGLQNAPIRWIVDDVLKFLRRECKRGSRYDGIILDPPSFGRGNRGEVFKIERDLHEILLLCKAVLSDHPLFVLFTTHTPGMTPHVMGHLMQQMLGEQKGKIESGEMVVPSLKGWDLPAGSFARYRHVD